MKRIVEVYIGTGREGAGWRALLIDNENNAYNENAVRMKWTAFLRRAQKWRNMRFLQMRSMRALHTENWIVTLWKEERSEFGEKKDTKCLNMTLSSFHPPHRFSVLLSTPFTHLSTESASSHSFLRSPCCIQHEDPLHQYEGSGGCGHLHLHNCGIRMDACE